MLPHLFHPIFGETFGSNPWLVNRHQGPIVRYGRVITDFCIANYLDSTGKLLTSVAGSLGYVAPEVLNEKGYGNPVDLW